MNQTRSHSISKKLLSLILAMIMVLSLMPMTVFAQEDGEPVRQEELDAAQSAQNGQDSQENGDADTYAATDDSFYRIVHLDCGREYFSKDWIIALINEMAAAGYNQLQLAFGNGGFRFYLDDLSVGTYESATVRSALETGNGHYNMYGDDGKGTSNGEWIAYAPKTNALTEAEMDAIIAHAASKGIDIVLHIDRHRKMLSQNFRDRNFFIPDAVCLDTATCRLIHKARDPHTDRSQPAVACPTLLQEFLGGLAQLVQIGVRCDRSIGLTAFLGSDLSTQICDRHRRIFRLDRHSADIRYLIIDIQKDFLAPRATALDIDPGFHQNPLGKKIRTDLGHSCRRKPQHICQILAGCRTMVIDKF